MGVSPQNTKNIGRASEQKTDSGAETKPGKRIKSYHLMPSYRE